MSILEYYCSQDNGGLVLKGKFLHFTRQNILTDNAAMKQQLDMLDRVSHSMLPLVIFGEKGCGKDMIAQYALQTSFRSAAPFRKINCAYLTDAQIHQELFGIPHATENSLLNRSAGGTLYIENADLLTPQTQLKLIEYITSDQGKMSDIRYFVGMNRPADSSFPLLDAFFHQFNAMTFEIPPLRERPEDILLLSLHQLSNIRKEYQIERLISRDVMEALLRCEWPGNIRQLINTIDRMAFFSNSTLMDSVSLLQSSLSSTEQFYTEKSMPAQLPVSKSLKEIVLEYEVMIINRYIDEFGSLRKAAAALHTSPSVLSSKITKYNKSSSPNKHRE